MRSLIYVDVKNKYLVERYLLNDSLQGINLVCENTDSNIEFLNELKKKYNVSNVIKVNFENIANVDSLKNYDQLIIPTSLPNRKLFFVPNTHFPDIKPVYKIVRLFSFNGIKDFKIFNLSGYIKFKVPYILDEFEDRHKGERCFIVGNGPSLNNIDMTLLKDEITFGSNQCYRGYDKWGFQFTYWGIEDRLQIEEYQEEYEQNVPENSIKFYPFEYLPFLNFKNFCPINHRYGVANFPQFSGSSDFSYLGGSVTYMLMQVAVVMGFKEIYLVGMDHKYELKGAKLATMSIWDFPRPVRKIIQKIEKTLIFKIINKIYRKIFKKKKGPKLWTPGDAKSATHFNSGYTKGKKFIMPRPKRVEVAYKHASQWAKDHGIKILNATPDTGLHSFDKIKYESLFGIEG